MQQHASTAVLQLRSAPAAPKLVVAGRLLTAGQLHRTAGAQGIKHAAAAFEARAGKRT